MKKSLTRSISYWLLLVLSLASAAVGAWLISDNAGIMTAKLLDGTATGVEVYVGQPMIVVGAVLLGAGVVGVLLTLALAAAKSLVPTAAPVAVEPIDWTADAEGRTGAVEDSTGSVTETPATETAADESADDEDQNSSDSTATATNINVR
ncbi:hypothetical protein [Microbacterium murale]|uniref:UPF0716 family protein affecting phage T7 exclusion n=1 Tax=Microbacterium murale TaxID=1081040 RepID=A0ABU0PEI4_9MICO|nr:hypothetical protein [Microbacterium murale]MDQ0645737.1 UPF0716 family protein affecting phage T7 exclusion [Microbacterium murale]